MLANASQGLQRLGDVLEKNLTALAESTPRTPSRINHGTVVTLESSPIRAQHAITHASTLETEHLGDASLVMKFICFLESNPHAVITYNTLVKTGNVAIREAYVKECIRKYEAETHRKDLGL